MISQTNSSGEFLDITILLIEDIDTDVKILMRAFNKAKFDCRVFKVSEGQEALDFLKNEGEYTIKSKFPHPDIILLDIKMPGMDGYTFVQELKALDDVKNIPIIVFTTQKDQEDLFKIEGVADYIVKTIDAKDLIERIKHILEKK